MFCKKVVAAAAVSAFATGVAAIGCSDDTVTIESTGDASVAAACGKIKGNLVIDTPMADQLSIDLTGLSSVGGDFTAKNNRIVSLVAPDLETIGGTFMLNNLTALSELSMTSLSEVQTIDWATLTNLGTFDFGTTGITKADTITIGDTFLSSVKGINVDSLTNMDLNNNGRLMEFSSNMKSMEVQLSLNANSDSLAVSLPELVWIANMSISDIASIDIPKLQTVNGSMRFDHSTFESFSAPNLTESSTGDISFVSCGQATNISFPMLEKIGGGFTVANNTKLAKIDGFEKVAEIGGAAAFRGSFTELDMPALNDVKGGFEIISTESIQDVCSHFQELHDDDTIQGKFNCKGKQQDANSDTSPAKNNNGGSSSTGGNGDQGGDAASIGRNFITIAAAAGLAVMFSTL